MGKSSAPSTPDYSPIASADAAAATQDANTEASSLAFAKQQYAAEEPTTQAYVQSMTANSNAQTADATADQNRYTSVYEPMQNTFNAEASNYNSPAMASQASGAAEADVGSQFNQQRASSLSSLESYGIDPSQTRYGALDLGTRVSQAAATAAAGTQSRLNTQQTGMNLQSQAIAQGANLPGQAQAAYSGASSSGGAGVQSGLNTSNTYGNLMGTASQWAGNQSSALGGQTSALGAGFNNAATAATINNQNTSNEMSGVGSLIGGVGMLALSDRRLKQDIHKVGALKSGVPLYTFRYKGDNTGALRMGVMAQELRKSQPGAVVQMPSGYLAVDYGMVK